MRSTLFTLIVDYAGGTYLGQVACPSIAEIPAALEGAVDWAAVSPRPSPRSLRRFFVAMADDTPTPIQGLRNVWCLTAFLGRRLAMVHVVKTQPNDVPRATKRTRRTVAATDTARVPQAPKRKPRGP